VAGARGDQWVDPSRPTSVRWPHGLVAFWNFHGDDAVFAPAAGRPGVGALRVVAGAPGRVVDGPFGYALTFDGHADALAVPAAEVGPVNVGATGDEVSVLAWIRREASGSSQFIAGIWVEDNNAPKRQYGLFIDLPVYGGADRVCGHTSRTGGPSPGLPFSRDYSASRRTVGFHDWHLVAFTYDGEHAVSFLNGTAESFPDYQEPGPPLGAGLRYTKNPYRVPDGQGQAGLNNAAADFTVGWVQLTGRPGNHFAGAIGGIAVFDRALTSAEVKDIARATATWAGAPPARSAPEHHN
jgi:hypothetical protein